MERYVIVRPSSMKLFLSSFLSNEDQTTLKLEKAHDFSTKETCNMYFFLKALLLKKVIRCAMNCNILKPCCPIYNILFCVHDIPTDSKWKVIIFGHVGR